MQHGELIGATRVYDGSALMFLPIKLESKTTLISTKRDDAQVQVTITLTSEIFPGSPTYMQLFNTIFRRYIHVLV